MARKKPTRSKSKAPPVAKGREQVFISWSGERGQKIAAIGTASLRDAKDGPDFRQEAEKILGAPLEIISGDEEARLVALAVQRAFPSDEQRVAFDIGGGSSEFVLLHGEKILGRRSYQLGSVKFFERFIRSDPPTKKEMQDMRSAALETFAELPFEAPTMQSASQPRSRARRLDARSLSITASPPWSVPSH